VRILIVDDASVIRARLRSMLIEVAGHVSVDEAVDVGDALAILRRQRPDVIVLDLHLPDRSGFAVLEALRSEPLPPRCVVVTNAATEQHRREALRLGADDFFDKSREFEDAVAVIARMVAPSDSAPRDV